MVKVEDKLIMQPFGDRGGVVIEPMLTDQWYVDAKTLAQPPMAAVRDGQIRIQWPGTAYPITAGYARGGALDGPKAWLGAALMKAMGIFS